MALSPLTIVLRCTNAGSYAATPYKDITLYGWGVFPVPEPDPLGEQEVGVDGHLSQNIVQREKWQIAVESYSIDASDNDHGDLELLRRYLRAKKVYIKSVTGSTRTNTTADGVTDYDYWAAIGQPNTFLPVEVVAAFDPPSYGGGHGTIVVNLTATLPQVGVSIT